MSKWPKQPPPLSDAQRLAREQYMLAWHQMLPNKYGALENFNHASVANLPHAHGCRTLEIGAGIGGHLPYERLGDQDYYCVEYREEFCVELRKKHRVDRVVCSSIQDRQAWPDGYFDRGVAIHVLEHLPDLPKALQEMHRLLAPTGVFDVVLPCEGGLAYELARTVSSRRYFEKRFKMSYTPIIKNEHLSTLGEVQEELAKAGFVARYTRYFPLLLPVAQINLVVAFRYIKK